MELTTHGLGAGPGPGAQGDGVGQPESWGWPGAVCTPLLSVVAQRVRVMESHGSGPCPALLCPVALTSPDIPGPAVPTACPGVSLGLSLPLSGPSTSSTFAHLSICLLGICLPQIVSF